MGYPGFSNYFYRFNFCRHISDYDKEYRIGTNKINLADKKLYSRMLSWFCKTPQFTLSLRNTRILDV